MEVIFRDLQNVVKKHFPNSEFDTCNVLKWVRGTTHLVYFIEVDKKKYVLSMNFKDIRSFHREIWAYQNFNKWYIPCPKLFFYDESNEIVPYPYMILECVDGEHPELNKEVFTYLSNEFLPSIHSIKIGGFGWINENGNGSFNSWKDFLEDLFRKSFPNIKAKNVLDDELLVKIKKLYNIMISQINLNQGFLIIGDLHNENMFFKNGTFYKLIDFELLMSGDPIVEYSSFYYTSNNLVWPFYIPNTQDNQRKFYFYSILIVLYSMNKYLISSGDISNELIEKLKEYVSKLNMLIQVDLPQ